MFNVEISNADSQHLFRNEVFDVFSRNGSIIVAIHSVEHVALRGVKKGDKILVSVDGLHIDVSSKGKRYRKKAKPFPKRRKMGSKSAQAIEDLLFQLNVFEQVVESSEDRAFPPKFDLILKPFTVFPPSYAFVGTPVLGPQDPPPDPPDFVLDVAAPTPATPPSTPRGRKKKRVPKRKPNRDPILEREQVKRLADTERVREQERIRSRPPIRLPPLPLPPVRPTGVFDDVPEMEFTPDKIAKDKFHREMAEDIMRLLKSTRPLTETQLAFSTEEDVVRREREAARGTAFMSLRDWNQQDYDRRRKKEIMRKGREEDAKERVIRDAQRVVALSDLAVRRRVPVMIPTTQSIDDLWFADGQAVNPTVDTTPSVRRRPPRHVRLETPAEREQERARLTALENNLRFNVNPLVREFAHQIGEYYGTGESIESRLATFEVAIRQDASLLRTVLGNTIVRALPDPGDVVAVGELLLPAGQEVARRVGTEVPILAERALRGTRDVVVRGFVDFLTSFAPVVGDIVERGLRDPILTEITKVVGKPQKKFE